MISAMTEAGVTDFASVISDLKAKLVSTNESIVELSRRRRPRALAAATGDAQARKAIEQLDILLTAARNEAETLSIAIEEAEKRKAEQEANVATQDRQRREAEARDICKAILKKDREFDKAAANLHAILSERQQLIQQLAGLNVIYSGMIKALQRRRQINGALIHAGLHEFADLNLPGPDARKPLTEADKSLSNPLTNTARPRTSKQNQEEAVP